MTQWDGCAPSWRAWAHMHDSYEDEGREGRWGGGHDAVAANLLSNVTLLFSVRAKQGGETEGREQSNNSYQNVNEHSGAWITKQKLAERWVTAACPLEMERYAFLMWSVAPQRSRDMKRGKRVASGGKERSVQASRLVKKKNNLD